MECYEIRYIQSEKGYKIGTVPSDEYKEGGMPVDETMVAGQKTRPVTYSFGTWLTVKTGTVTVEICGPNGRQRRVLSVGDRIRFAGYTEVQQRAFPVGRGFIAGFILEAGPDGVTITVNRPFAATNKQFSPEWTEIRS